MICIVSSLVAINDEKRIITYITTKINEFFTIIMVFSMNCKTGQQICFIIILNGIFNLLII